MTGNMAKAAHVPMVFTFEGETVEEIVELDALDLSADDGDLLRVLTNRDANLDAAWAASGIAYGQRPVNETAVYVAAKTEAYGCKVGSSGNPLSRIGFMQVGASPDLYLAALFWTLGAKPFGLERMAVKEAGRRGRRVHGEWLSMTPEEAATLILHRARETDALIADSEMHLWNMKAIARAEWHAHVRFIEREWGLQRAAYWKSQNPLAE